MLGSRVHWEEWCVIVCDFLLVFVCFLRCNSFQVEWIFHASYQKKKKKVFVSKIVMKELIDRVNLSPCSRNSITLNLLSANIFVLCWKQQLTTFIIRTEEGSFIQPKKKGIVNGDTCSSHSLLLSHCFLNFLEILRCRYTWHHSPRQSIRGVQTLLSSGQVFKLGTRRPQGQVCG